MTLSAREAADHEQSGIALPVPSPNAFARLNSSGDKCSVADSMQVSDADRAAEAYRMPHATTYAALRNLPTDDLVRLYDDTAASATLTSQSTDNVDSSRTMQEIRDVMSKYDEAYIAAHLQYGYEFNEAVE